MNLLEDQPMSIDQLRSTLIRLEDTIIFNLIERAQYPINATIYSKDAFNFPNFKGSFMEFMLYETECVHAKARRYSSPDENAFFPDNLPEPVIPALEFPQIIKRNSINVNKTLLNVYVNDLIPELCSTGEDNNFGSSATRDVDCLQNLSRRIHYGKFIAEAKFSDLKYHDTYVRLIRSQDSASLMNLLTDKEVEQKLLARLHLKAATYGQDISQSLRDTSITCKIDPTTVVKLYQKWIIPLTKEVEVLYLLHRLDNEPTTETINNLDYNIQDVIVEEKSLNDNINIARA